MKKITLGTPDEFVPSRFCPGFRYEETPVSYPVSNFVTHQTDAGFVVEFPLEDDCQIFGFGLQLKQFNHRGRRLKLAVNADPVTANGETHAPVPFFVTNKGYGMYFDTARYAEFYCGKQKNPILSGQSASSEGGAADNEADLYAARRENALWMSVKEERLLPLALLFCLSRSLSGLALTLFPLAPGSGLARSFAEAADRKRVRAILALLSLGLSLGLILCGAWAAVPAAALVFAAYYRICVRQFEGLSGDLAGWFLQTAELWMLAALLL